MNEDAICIEYSVKNAVKIPLENTQTSVLEQIVGALSSEKFIRMRDLAESFEEQGKIVVIVEFVERNLVYIKQRRKKWEIFLKC